VGLTAARSAGVVNFGETPIPYPAYVVLSMSLWQLFAASVSRPIAGLQAARSMLTKVDFPREAIIVSELSKITVTALVQSALVVLVFLYFGIPFGQWAPLAIFPITVLVLTGVTIGLFLAPAALLYGDVGNALPMGLGALFLVTPVVYSPPQSGGIFSLVVELNPVTSIIETARNLLLGTPMSHAAGFLVIAALIPFIAALGMALFRVSMPVVIERWSS
jgi:lipopolysaccharide transport system permease protein